MKRIELLLAALLAVASASSAASWEPKIPETVPAPLSGDLMQTTVHRLRNGLTVYLSPNAQKPRIAAWIAVRAGSKHDPADSTGMAHYLEHMLFKGSDKFGTLDYSKEKPHLDRILALYEKHFATADPEQRKNIYKEIDKESIAASKYAIPNEFDKVYRQLGIADLNAFTSDEQTVYVADMPSNRLEAWAKVEADRFSNPVFRLFQSELEAVYEEKNRSMDNAERIIGEALNKALYKAHPYGQQPTIGLLEHLKNPSLRKMYEYYARWYRPNNMAIALAGDFERQNVLAVLEKTLGAWVPQALPAPKAWPLPKPKGRELVEVRYEAEEKVIVSWPLVPKRHPDADALTVMDMLMDNAATGIINLTLNQAQLVKAAGSYPSFYNEAGDWSVWAVPKLGQTVEQAEGLLMGTLDKLKAGEFSDDDIRAIITNFEVGEKARLESNGARVGMMADSFISLEPWAETVSRLDRLRRVTKDDVVRVARKYLGDDRVVALRRSGKPELPTITKPNFTKVEIDTARQSQFAAGILSMPVVPPTPRWISENKDYFLREEAWGRLYMAPNPSNDLFSLSFNFERGQGTERELCAAFDLLELSGGGALTAEQFKRKLYALGTTMGLGCGERGSSVSLSGLEKNLWASLELLEQRFAAPNTEPDTLKKLVEVELGRHQDNKKDPGYVHFALGDLAKRGADSQVLKQLTDAELKALKTERLQSLIKEAFSYKRRVGYIGSRPAGELAKLLDRGPRFKEPPARPKLPLRRPTGDEVTFTHRDMVQARVGVFGEDGAVAPEQVVDYLFYGNYMGGDMSAVIFQEIREARSLAYSASGGYEYADYKGEQNELWGRLGCQADKTPEAAELLRRLLREPPLDEKRFRETAKALEEDYRTNPLDFRSVPGALMGWEDLGLSLSDGDPRPKRFERVLKYTLDDLRAFSSRFKAKPMGLWVLGHRERVGLDALKGLGRFEEKTLEQIFPY